MGLAQQLTIRPTASVECSGWLRGPFRAAWLQVAAAARTRKENFMRAFVRLSPVAAALLLATLAPVHAQTANRSVVQVPQRAAPANITPGTPGSAVPNPAGLPSPTPSPGGLTSPFPAGLPSPSPFPAGMPPVASPVVRSLPPASAGTGGTGTTGSPGTVSTTTATGTVVTPVIDGTILGPTMTLGAGVSAAGSYQGNASSAASTASTAGAAGGGTAMGAGPSGPGPGPYTALQLSQSFLQADANRDGDLTRAEAQRLTIAPLGFDDMDRNKDGLVSRSEYDDSTR
jgi:hypothetical protein